MGIKPLTSEKQSRTPAFTRAWIANEGMQQWRNVYLHLETVLAQSNATSGCAEEAGDKKNQRSLVHKHTVVNIVRVFYQHL